MKVMSYLLGAVLLVLFAVTGFAQDATAVAQGKVIIKSNNAPEAIGPYSQAVKVGNMVYTAGQIGINPKTGKIPAGIEAQTTQVLNNLKAVIEKAGGNMSSIVKTTVFVKDLNDYGKVNAIYATYFKKDFPSRSCVEVSRLPKDVLVEIEAIAYLGE
jgi:2-iminobutanoate/2-iminopropanoate deaminase